MSTIADKLEYLNETKQAIKTAIVEKGVEVADTDTFRSYADKIAEIQTGGGEEQELFLCRVIDWEGTILKEEWLPSGATFTMPADPIYEGLVFDGWSSPVDIVDGQVVVEDIDIIIGAMYYTASGLTEVDIELNAVTGLDVTFNMVGNKDWGDGTTDDLTTHTYAEYGKYTITCDGTSLNVSYVFGQASDNENKYVVSVRPSVDAYIQDQSPFAYCIALKSLLIPKFTMENLTTLPSSICHYMPALKALVVPNKITNINRSLREECESLENLVIPNTVTNLYIGRFYGEYLSIPKSVGTMKIEYCQRLKTLRFFGSTISSQSTLYGYCLETIDLSKSTITRVPDYFGLDLYALKKLLLPNTCRSLAYNIFTNVRSLKSVDLSNITSIGGSSVTGSFTYAYSMTEMKLPPNAGGETDRFMEGNYAKGVFEIPEGIRTIATPYSAYCIEKVIFPSTLRRVNSIGNNCYACLRYDFTKATSIPELRTSSAFRDINPLCKIVVPDALYDEWIVASNWSNFANYIVRASEYTGD